MHSWRQLGYSLPMTGQLQRQLGVSDAVIIGAGSMIGAGVFASWGPAAQAAGNGTLVALAIAGVVALCNATSSAQLAAIHTESGGTYLYGRRQISPAVGHLAGWGFVVGKTASCAAMALTIGAYLWPQQQKALAVAAVVAITAVNIGGLSRTVAVTRVLLGVSLTALVIVVASGWTGGEFSTDRISPLETSLGGVLEAAGFMFFAFAGYARIATLGEEVKEPEITIPKAIPRALIGVLAIYLVVAVTTFGSVDATTLGAGAAPLRLVTDTASSSLGAVVGIGAGIASLGVLLNLIPGISRTALAMARNGELPGWFSHIDAKRSLPLRAELTVAAVAIALVVTLEVRSAIAISGVAILTYYAITNAAALTLEPNQRRWTSGFAWVGLVGCAVLVFSLPTTAILTGGATLLLGVAVRALSVQAAGTN